MGGRKAGRRSGTDGTLPQGGTPQGNRESVTRKDVTRKHNDPCHANLLRNRCAQHATHATQTHERFRISPIHLPLPPSHNTPATANDAAHPAHKARVRCYPPSDPSAKALRPARGPCAYKRRLRCRSLVRLACGGGACALWMGHAHTSVGCDAVAYAFLKVAPKRATLGKALITSIYRNI